MIYTCKYQFLFIKFRYYILAKGLISTEIYLVKCAPLSEFSLRNCRDLSTASHIRYYELSNSQDNLKLKIDFSERPSKLKWASSPSQY